MEHLLEQPADSTGRVALERHEARTANVGDRMFEVLLRGIRFVTAHLDDREGFSHLLTSALNCFGGNRNSGCRAIGLLWGFAPQSPKGARHSMLN